MNSNKTNNLKLLLVEDDSMLTSALKSYMESQGVTFRAEARGDRAVDRVREFLPDAVILDCALPGKDGYEICRELRPMFSGPILMFTAKDEEIDHLLGLGLGADAYLVKPIRPNVLLAHVRACLRRAGTGFSTTEPEDIRFGRFLISRVSRDVVLGSESISFSTAEFDLLWLLAKHAGKVLSRDEIKAALRNIDHDAFDRSIDMRISRLRRRLGDDAENPRRIKTVRGKGYLFSRTDWE